MNIIHPFDESSYEFALFYIHRSSSSYTSSTKYTYQDYSLLDLNSIIKKALFAY